MKLYVCPVVSCPEPHDTTGSPGLGVTVWYGTPDCSMVQVTVLLTPMTTVMLFGEKAKLLMVTPTVLWATAVGAEGTTERAARARRARRATRVDFGVPNALEAMVV